MNANSTSEELHAAARSGDLKAVQTICSSNPLAVNSRDRHSRTPLHLAAWSGHADVLNFLCKNKADIGAAAMDDMGAIHFAAQKGHLEVIKILLTSGISIKSCNRKGMTALHFAAQGSHLEIVKYLVKKGANTDSKNKAGNTPFDLASSEEVRSFLADCKSASGKPVIDGREKDEKAEPKSPPKEEVEGSDGDTALHGGEEAEDGKDELMKRKGDIEDIKENQPETKKSKVALNHLLAADDVQEEDDF